MELKEHGGGVSVVAAKSKFRRSDGSKYCSDVVVFVDNMMMMIIMMHVDAVALKRKNQVSLSSFFPLMNLLWWWLFACCCVILDAAVAAVLWRVSHFCHRDGRFQHRRSHDGRCQSCCYPLPYVKNYYQYYHTVLYFSIDIP